MFLLSDFLTFLRMWCWWLLHSPVYLTPWPAALQSPCDWLWPLTTDTLHSLLSSASVSCLRWVWVGRSLLGGEERSSDDIQTRSWPRPLIGHRVTMLLSDWSELGSYLVRDQPETGLVGPELLCLMWVMGGGWGNGLVCLDWESCFMLSNAKYINKLTN